MVFKLTQKKRNKCKRVFGDLIQSRFEKTLEYYAFELSELRFG